MKPQQSIDRSTEWLGRLCYLYVAKTPERGYAPHKPLLLLCIMDMIEDGAITTQWIPYSPELLFRFQCYWAIVYDRQRNNPNMRLPFHALGGTRDRIWTRHMEDGEPSRSRETSRLCHLDESLWKCVQDNWLPGSAPQAHYDLFHSRGTDCPFVQQIRIARTSSEEIIQLRQSADAYKESMKERAGFQIP